MRKILTLITFLVILTQTQVANAESYDYAWITQLEDCEKDRIINVYSFFDEESKEPTSNVVAHHYTGTNAASIYYYIDQVCKTYDGIDRDLLEAIIWQESSYNPKARNSTCYGLMQINNSCHKKRASSLSFSINSTQDWYDIETNITVGTDLFWDILSACDGNETKALMMYNMGNRGATLYDRGVISNYAKSVLQKRDIIREERLRGEELWRDRMNQIRQREIAAQLELQKLEKTA